MSRTAGRTGGTDVSPARHGGAASGMPSLRSLPLALLVVLCALGLCTAGSQAGAEAASHAMPPGQHAAQSALGQHLHAQRPADSIDPGSTCHDGPGTPADALLPAPLALHVPPPDPAPPAARVVATAGISGPNDDRAREVDLHRLRIQRT